MFSDFRYKDIFEDNMVVNMFTAYQAWLWGFMHSTDGVYTGHGGNSPRWKYGWLKWERSCYAFDMVAGQAFSFIDGEQNAWEQQKNADIVFNGPLEKANKKIKEADLITDVIVGCFLTEDLTGKIGAVFYCLNVFFYIFH